MDKQKEIENIAYEICNYVKSKDMNKVYVVAESPMLEYLHNTGIAEWLVEKGYGDVRSAVNKTAKDIFSWIYKNLVNMNFITGNVEINLSSLQNFAKTYGVEIFDIFKQGGKQ